MHLLEPHQLAQIEQEHAGGLTAQTIVDIFTRLGARLSEATFRKYVQVGLVPRSRRVGRKGKHQGSRGLYPVAAVRSVNLIKMMMEEGLTIEDIKRSFVFFRNEIEVVERALDNVLDVHERELGARQLKQEVKKSLEREVQDARESGKRLVRQLERIASGLVAGESCAQNFRESSTCAQSNAQQGRQSVAHGERPE